MTKTCNDPICVNCNPVTLAVVDCGACALKDVKEVVVEAPEAPPEPPEPPDDTVPHVRIPFVSDNNACVDVGKDVGKVKE